MRTISFSLVALVAMVCAASAEWPHLKTTWGPVPGIGSFYNEPRTQQVTPRLALTKVKGEQCHVNVSQELIDDGWVQLSSCAEDNVK